MIEEQLPTGLDEFTRWLSTERDMKVSDYAQLWRWSVDDLPGFWSAIRDYYQVRGSYTKVLGARTMPGAQWFPDSDVNYAEQMLEVADPTTTAIIALSEDREPEYLSFGELRNQVARARTGLHRLGVRQGDCVVGYLPNAPEALVAYLAAASLGAIWSCCATEFGSKAVIDRFVQLEPKVLIAVDRYRYGAKHIDRAEDLASIRAGLPTLTRTIVVQGDADEGAMTWDELVSEDAAPTYARLPFAHPLHVLFSSGTTGLPKAIVHGHGGIIVEHLKAHGLHLDTRPGDRAFWFTTTAWTMWNIAVSALLRQAAVVMYDGSPTHPSVDGLWDIARTTGATLVGTSPGYIMANRRAGSVPGDLPALRTLGVTGAPLPNEGFDWVDEHFSDTVQLNVMSGGTDICGAFVSGNSWLPVVRGEMSGPSLGADVAAFDEHGRPIVGSLGELVVRSPMPSMPVGFWNDPEGERYRSSYFDVFEGVWRHGDWARFSQSGSCVISGRSDATLNRGGVRLGTAEFYGVVEELPEIADSLVVHLEDSAGGSGELALFVVLDCDQDLDEQLVVRIRTALREALSPRHVPDRIEAVSAIPRTPTGKKMEKPVKEILRGVSPEKVLAAASVVPAGSLIDFERLASKSPIA